MFRDECYDLITKLRHTILGIESKLGETTDGTPANLNDVTNPKKEVASSSIAPPLSLNPIFLNSKNSIPTSPKVSSPKEAVQSSFSVKSDDAPMKLVNSWEFNISATQFLATFIEDAAPFSAEVFQT